MSEMYFLSSMIQLPYMVSVAFGGFCVCVFLLLSKYHGE